MKITQEVRDFAAKQAADRSSLSRSDGEGDHPQDGGGALSPSDAEAGMAQMSQLYREGGNELYIGANGREHD
jgi:phosphomethylpyrimidine synthase